MYKLNSFNVKNETKKFNNLYEVLYLALKLNKMAKRQLRKQLSFTGESREMVNPETGELENIPTLKNTGYLTETREIFYMVYAAFWGVILDNGFTIRDVQVFGYLLENYGAGRKIGIPLGIRKDIAERTKMSEGTVSNVLNKLCKTPENNPVLFKTKEKSIYILNPVYAFKGSTNERKGSIKAVFELGFKEILD